MVAAVAVKFSVKALIKLRKLAPIAKKAGKIGVKFVRGGPRRKAFSIEKEQIRGPSPVADTIAVMFFEKVTRPIFSAVKINLPSSKATAAELTAAVERGDFEVSNEAIATAIIGGTAVRDQILFEATQDESVNPALRTGLKILLFVL